jgi:hypothetical protein
MKENPMKRVVGRMFRILWSQRFSAFAALAGFGLLFTASLAKAGCGIPGKPGAPVPIPFVAPPDDQEWQEASIVGLWHLIYTATSVPIPGSQPPLSLTPPFQFLESYKMWHADGTEWENAFLAPAGGNICFGVWKKLKDRKVQLHHIGLMFDPASGKVSNVFTVDEIDEVAPHGQTYSGSFDFKLFPDTDVYGTGKPIGEIKGNVAGTRITIPNID